MKFIGSESFNNWASGFAALFGILATVFAIWATLGTRAIDQKTLDLQNKIANLDEDFKVASIVSGLVKNLSDPDLERDLALIALRDSLASDFDNQREQNIYLVFNVASAIADNAISRTIEQSKLEPQKVNDEIGKLQYDLKIARSIMEKFSLIEHPKKSEMLEEKNRIDQDINSLKVQLNEQESREASSEKKTGGEKQSWLVVFSTDPALSIDKPISAEFEVQIARDELGEKAIVFQRDNLFSTALMFKTREEAQSTLSVIKEKLNRNSAFVTSLDGFCPNVLKIKETAIGGGDRYKYKFYKCSTAS